MRIIVENNYKELSKRAANILASQIILNLGSLLGLSTGSTPIETYNELN